MLKILRGLFGIFILLQITAAYAALKIEIIGAGEHQTPISIVPFGGDAKAAKTIHEVIIGDLLRSGLFRIVDNAGKSPTTISDVNYSDWRGLGAEALAIGTVTTSADGGLTARFRLLDAVKQNELLGQEVSTSSVQIRALGHRISDLIYEKLTGDKGVFSTRIAYVNRLGKQFSLVIADSDGYNEQNVLTQNEPILSPVWSPDGSRLAYVSFETGRAAVFVQSLYTNQRMMLANFRGSNSSPAWSSDGKQLAVVLTKDGNSQIYLMRTDGTDIRRLSANKSIDTEPNFSPDSQNLLFTSDQGGSAQIYRMPITGGTVQRMTFGDGKNFSPRYSPDGKSFVFMHSVGGKFHIATQDFQTGQMQILTEGGLEKRPSFAPNGKLILFARESRGRGILATVSSDGRVKQHMFTQTGDAREPIWGP